MDDQPYALAPSETARSKLIATRSIPRGTLLLASPRPTSHVLLDACKGVRCDECMAVISRPGRAKLRCTGCQEDIYCSVSCQKAAWNKHHRVLCPKLPALVQKLGQVQLPEADRLDAVLLARLAIEHFTEPGLDPFTTSFYNPTAKTYISLLRTEPPPSHPPTPLPQILASLLPEFTTKANFLGWLLQRFSRNNHVLLSNDVGLEPFANVVLVDVSRSVNHSCAPAAVVSHQIRRGIGVRTVRDLEEGDEITISYLDPILSTSSRKKALLHTYDFTCICPLCSNPPINPFRPFPIPRPSSSSFSSSPNSSPPPPYPPIPTPTRPLPLSENQLTKLTVGFEEAHKEGRWDVADQQGDKVLMVYWGAYGGFGSPIVGTHLLSLSQISLNRAILLPQNDPQGLSHLARAEMFVSWARTVLEVLWGKGEDVEGVCAGLEDRVTVERGS